MRGEQPAPKSEQFLFTARGADGSSSHSLLRSRFAACAVTWLTSFALQMWFSNCTRSDSAASPEDLRSAFETWKPMPHVSQIAVTGAPWIVAVIFKLRSGTLIVSPRYSQETRVFQHCSENRTACDQIVLD